MASSPTISADDSSHEPPGSIKLPDPTAFDEKGSLKLGDFTTRLNSEHLTLWASPPATRPITLGNFQRLFHRLGVKDPKDSPRVEPTSPPKATPITILKRPAEATSSIQSITLPQATSDEPQVDPITDSETGSGSDSDLLPGKAYSTAASTPPSSTESPLENLAKQKKTKTKASKAKEKAHHRDTSQSEIEVIDNFEPELPRHLLITYQYVKYGPTTDIYGHAESAEVKHESLMTKLVHQRVTDSTLSKAAPEVASNGIHVFIDMSNIIIGFQKALRARYSLPEFVRFIPLPQMNLEFFHKLLVRDRHAEWLNVGCSMHPDKQKPHFIEELEDLGYRVDLRSRRPQNMAMEGHGSRYVEDMVDETLQIRIGESVMQYFDKPGTLVLATGDARPAKYSDGFLAYAQRALKMGWNVEVVSWRSSLSSAWSGVWKEEGVGSRFRVIELDQFLDELWTC
ncbi:hypothetical protein CEP54_007367 [Fusarium duplospermum]|uniref:NYN domain-containing protein n=1 Tax=Fusarium duplospermum TaxID=1325734 RepID=A0A428Q1R0_9HYPO|nr:hypothetical protein CEP54_007367 [Fusarium duplospermum]